MRPYVICHMTASLDGKVTGDFLSADASARAIELYYELNRAFAADAYACGRVTMEESFTGGFYPELSSYEGEKLPREDFVAPYGKPFFAVAFDRRGRLGFRASLIEDEDEGYGGAHIIEVLCEDVSDAYLAYLKDMGISYIFAGKTEMSVDTALEKLYRLFGIKKLLLEGGSVLNGAFLREELVDEISLVTAPIVANSTDKPLFDSASMNAFTLASSKARDGVLLSRYLKK